jgi:zinc transporter ZupT
VRALLDVGLDAWFWWRDASGGLPPGDAEIVVLQIRAGVSMTVGVLGYLLLAIGLWSTSSGTARPVAVAIALLLGAAALAVGIALPFVAASRDAFFSAGPWVWLLYGLSALVPAAIGVLAAAAVAAMPRRFFLPELLVAIGGCLMVVCLSLPDVMTALLSTDQLVRMLWINTTANAGLLIGFSVMALGFALGRVSAVEEPVGGLSVRT